MSRKPLRPPSVTVFAVFQIIFGIFSLIGTAIAFASVSGAMNSKPKVTQTSTVSTTTGTRTTTSTTNLDLEQELADRIPGYRAFMWASTIVSLASALLMLASGVGMFGLHPWSRKMAMLWAILYILDLVASLVFALLYYIPAANAIADKWEQLPTPGPELALGTRMGAYGQLGAPITVIYPALLLFFMTRSHVRDAFAGIARRRDEDDYDDRDRDRYNDRDRDRDDDRDRDRDDDRDRYRDRDRDRYDDRGRGGSGRERDSDDRYRSGEEPYRD